MTNTDNLKGIVFMLATCLIITLSTVLIKTLGQNINTFEVVMMRCFITVLITLTLNFQMGKLLFQSSKPGLVSLRSLLTGFVVLTNFYSVSNLPLVEVTSLQFSKPLFLIILAAVFLGEKIRLRRTSATILGFIGIIVVLHPWDSGSSEIKLAHLAVLGAAFGMAGLAILSRKLTIDHHPTTLVLYANIVSVLMCIGPALYYWTMPTNNEFMLIAMLGLTTYCAQFCMISAYKYAEVTVATPFEYFRIIFAAIAGYLVFSELPDIWTISGGTIICGSTLFIAFREAQKNRLRKRQLEA
ncbi:MAG: DMT family transporter [Kordiimonadaceae bacterium]|nr:DMT family transporter [Kordiimonadaceae bacterium]MBT6034986.1 DMT family transporter [Kordiimonadaceae bacterium]MBT7582161.1 DMT family transporter [Kordiimonadaceae bacterium]